ncbi:TPA: hypothetical protein GDO54_018439 [Pyxicephalus adspersus]|uniref:Uncharacterized protein n=1 Tax=Pyxicephalus adspersus TaxID=30357 RepID=A0AAV2ZGB3_PYXAD|nr:TPA: hypothetical protein GDO54_018439 [Pyxicephalus adspersus]
MFMSPSAPIGHYITSESLVEGHSASQRNLKKKRKNLLIFFFCNSHFKNTKSVLFTQDWYSLIQHTSPLASESTLYRAPGFLEMAAATQMGPAGLF